jgi:hypothetical protein
LLADAQRFDRRGPEDAIDPTRLEGLRRPDACLIADFVSEILELRGEPRPGRLRFVPATPEILATTFLEEIHDALLQASVPPTRLRYATVSDKPSTR